MKLSERNDLPLIRIIIPAFPEINVFTRPAKKTTSLGPISVATAANKVSGWRVEVIDENNYRGPFDKQGMPDHESLEKENPAAAVGFYCGLSSTMDRVFKLAEFYSNREATIIASGLHVHYCPYEALDNHVDIVVHGDGEGVIQEILSKLINGQDISGIPGISFRDGGCIRTNPPAAIELSDLDRLPYPDFGLLRHARKLKIYPIGRIRGCRMNCKFCSVKGKPRWASPEHLFDVVNWLVDTRRAQSFFIVDDRLEEDLKGTLAFFRMICEKYRDRLSFTVQIRLEAAGNTEFLKAMRSAGVRTVCVGYESPIDEDLKAMRKGYLSRNMLEWTKALRRYFWVHGMFMLFFPNGQESKVQSVRETVKRFKTFIRKARLHSIQVEHPIPLVGTDLRKELEQEGRIFPLEVVPWVRYDGNYACFIPKNVSLKEFQEAPIRLMKWFYNPFSFLRISMWVIIFPIHFPIHYVLRGWQSWHRIWHRDIVRYGGHLLVRRWRKRQNEKLFFGRLEKYIEEISR